MQGTTAHSRRRSPDMNARKAKRRVTDPIHVPPAGVTLRTRLLSRSPTNKLPLASMSKPHGYLKPALVPVPSANAKLEPLTPPANVVTTALSPPHTTATTVTITTHRHHRLHLTYIFHAQRKRKRERESVCVSAGKGKGRKRKREKVKERERKKERGREKERERERERETETEHHAQTNGQFAPAAPDMNVRKASCE
jgi:hypothetical protein